MERADSDNEFSSVSKSRRFYRSCLVTGVFVYNMVITDIILSNINFMFR